MALVEDLELSREHHNEESDREEGESVHDIDQADVLDQCVHLMAIISAAVCPIEEHCWVKH